MKISIDSDKTVFVATHKETGKKYDVKAIHFDYNEVVVKRGSEKEQEIKDAGGHHCSSCDPEWDDWFKMDEVDIEIWV